MFFRLESDDLMAMPSLLFDEVQYLHDYPDIAKAVSERTISSAYEHYRLYGHNEGRRVKIFLNP
jgi:hypothetical protein